MEVKIKDKAVKKLITNMFVDHPNVSQAIDMLFATCPSNVIANMLDILLTEEPYVPFKRGAWVLVKLDGYQMREMGSQDILQDMNLMKGDKFIGYIEDSSNYGDDFEPYHEKMEVNTFICDSEGDVQQKLMSLYASELTLLYDQEAIILLNDIKNNLVT
jgi:hypothetical protein